MFGRYKSNAYICIVGWDTETGCLWQKSRLRPTLYFFFNDKTKNHSRINYYGSHLTKCYLSLIFWSSLTMLSIE